VDWLREHPQRLLAVTPEQVHEAARRVLAPATRAVTVVGDAALVGDPLRALGPVELT